MRPFVGAPDAGWLDLSDAVARPENLFPFGEFGGFALVWTAPHCREVHTFMLPEGRGWWARKARGEGVAMALEAGTRVLWTKVPPDAPHIEAFARGGGMIPTGETVDVLGLPYAIFSMEIH